jgi:tRNA threonylcarbamoyladenosine biosynthesis protein TsaB
MILMIHTALNEAFVALSSNGKVVAEKRHSQQNDLAAFLQPAIHALLQECNITIDVLKAVAVVEGPGSYTGLRVGMATAKGLCFALNIPLININTLFLLAADAKLMAGSLLTNAWICPMIDARRMEVYTALYDAQLQVLIQPAAVILDESYLDNLLEQQPIIFVGDGTEKWQQICKSKHAFFLQATVNPANMALKVHELWLADNFSNLIYAEPMYIKNFYTTAKAN